MSRAWLLPEQIADVLPSQARRVEELRRSLIDRAQAYGYELVMPPLVEHLESLLSGTGQELDLKTFKLVDQLSGRTIGLRADTTPQVARIDAHLLNREGVARLVYCGPVLHARSDSALASRELLQFGAEVYGHGGLEADLEVIDLALDALGCAGVRDVLLDLGDARILRSLLGGVPLDAARLTEVAGALAHKDGSALEGLASSLTSEVRTSLASLLRLHGGLTCWLRLAPRCHQERRWCRLWMIWPGWPITFNEPIPPCGSASTWQTCLAMRITAVRGLRSMRTESMPHWPVGGGMTRSAPCSAAIVPPSGSAWMSRNWRWQPLQGLCARRCGPLGANPRTCGVPSGSFASWVTPWYAHCPDTNTKPRSTTATGNWSTSPGNGCCAPFDRQQRRI
jgi:hypothetical protein